MAIEKYDVEDTDALTPAADLTGKEGYLAILASGGLNLSGAAGKVYGVILQGSTTASRTTVQLYGLARVVSAGTIAKGASIASNGSGAAVTATTGQFSPGIAREAAVTGQVFVVRLLAHAAP